MDIQYTFIREGKTETREAMSYVHTLAEIRRMLSQAGLRAAEFYASVQRDPYELGSPRLLLVAEKQ